MQHNETQSTRTHSEAGSHVRASQGHTGRASQRQTERTSQGQRRRFTVKKLLLSALISVGIVVLYLLLGTLLPLLHHKSVSDDYKEQLAATEWRSDEPGTERVLCVDDNIDALLLRLRMIDMAQEEILLSTFDFKDDESARDVMASLYAAAERGVSVKLLIDGFTPMYTLPDSAWFRAFAAHERVTVRFYNPPNLLLPWSAQCRLHDKYLLVDDTYYLLGGRNTYNVFLGNYSSGKNADRELFVYDTAPSEDSSVTQLKAYFDSIWPLSCNRTYDGDERERDDAANGSHSDDVDAYLETVAELLAHAEELRTTYAEAFAPTDLVQMTMPTDKISLLSNPTRAGNKEPLVWEGLVHLMSLGTSAVIQTPYIICSDEMYEDLKSLCENTQVSIVTNSVATGSNPFGCVDYEREQDNILATGVTVYEYYGTHPMHTKTILIDEDLSIVGSYNMDMRSTYLNTELMLVVDSEPLNALLRQDLESYASASRIPLSDGTYEYGERWKDATPSETLEKRMRWIRPFSPLIRHLM